MTVWVIREGKLVEKGSMAEARNDLRSIFPSPMVSRLINPFESPVTGKEITSWRERDRDMRAADAYDPRDLPKDHTFRRGRETQMKELADASRGEPEPAPFEWGKLTAKP
jgi:hypothetical protein